VNDGQNTKEASVSVFVVECENIDEQTAGNVMIYPNPAKDVINVELAERCENVSWTLVNVNGQVVKKSYEQYDSFVIKLDEINSGLYFLNLDIDGKQMMKKIVVE
jgi:hypothetical protein